jgi:hypothetical protein
VDPVRKLANPQNYRNVGDMIGRAPPTVVVSRMGLRWRADLRYGRELAAVVVGSWKLISALARVGPVLDPVNLSKELRTEASRVGAVILDEDSDGPSSHWRLVGK